MKSIILAAGRGTRLGTGVPKCLTTYKDKTLIEYTLEALRSNGIEDITIVKGYKSELIQHDVQSVMNEEYESTTMVDTLFCAEHLMDDDFIVSYSDIIYSPCWIKKLIESEANFAVAADRMWKLLWEARFDDPLADAESFKSHQGRITEIGNRIDSLDEAEGQYMGLFKIAKEEVSKVIDFYHHNLFRHMTDFIQQYAKTSPVTPVWGDGKWMEFDNSTDLEIQLPSHSQW